MKWLWSETFSRRAPMKDFKTTPLISSMPTIKLERLPTVPKTTVRDPPRANGWPLAHCPPSSEWGPGENTGEIKATRKGAGHPTPKSRWLRTSVLSNTHSSTYGSYMGLPLPLQIKHNRVCIIYG